MSGRRQPGSAEPVEPLAPTVGANLRRLRSTRGLSLERLARRAGVSRAMLSQTELGQSAPTINLLWKVARALDVNFAALVAGSAEPMPVLLPAREGKRLTIQEGTFSSRALFPLGERRRAEFYELRIKARGDETARELERSGDLSHAHLGGDTLDGHVRRDGAIDAHGGVPTDRRGGKRHLPVQ